MYRHLIYIENTDAETQERAWAYNDTSKELTRIHEDNVVNGKTYVVKSNVSLVGANLRLEDTNLLNDREEVIFYTPRKQFPYISRIKKRAQHNWDLL